jgi:hypothetical protein
MEDAQHKHPVAPDVRNRNAGDGFIIGTGGRRPPGAVLLVKIAAVEASDEGGPLRGRQTGDRGARLMGRKQP